MKQPCVLIVDDDKAHRQMLRTLIRGWGYKVEEAEDGQEAVGLVREHAYDAVLTDVRMAQMDGIAALGHIKAWNPAIPVIIMTAWSSVESAVDALRLGAYDYLTKPLDFDMLRLCLGKAMDHARQVSGSGDYSPGVDNQGFMLGRSATMQELSSLLATVGPTDATVLITGESGTGKELVARTLQQASPRKDKPFVTINCAALTESLLESELFGHEKGAFTGADRRREGRFVQAHTGTLFLDEVGEMALGLQAKLLRVLQQGEVQRVGSDDVLRVDVRLLAATNRNLQEEVAGGRFREDLYYRLNVIGVEVPPLRERKEDVSQLASSFLERYATANNKNLKNFTPQAMDCLLRYSWPGNVRELENAVERAVILSIGDYVDVRALPLVVQKGQGEAETASPVSMDAYSSIPLEELEKRAIEATLRETEDNKSEAARRLGITRATLHSKLKKYDLE